MKDIRRFGTIRRASDQWKAIYKERYAVKRPFKSLFTIFLGLAP